MVKKKVKKFRPHLNHIARKRRHAERCKKKCRSVAKVIRENWDISKTPRENVLSMGLAFNPNETVQLRQPRREIIDMVDAEEVSFTEARALGIVEAQRFKMQGKQAVLEEMKVVKVVSSLEQEANELQADRDLQPRTVRLPDRDVELLIYLSQRYKENYKGSKESVPIYAEENIQFDENL